MTLKFEEHCFIDCGYNYRIIFKGIDNKYMAETSWGFHTLWFREKRRDTVGGKQFRLNRLPWHKNVAVVFDVAAEDCPEPLREGLVLHFEDHPSIKVRLCTQKEQVWMDRKRRLDRINKMKEELANIPAKRRAITLREEELRKQIQEEENAA